MLLPLLPLSLLLLFVRPLRWQQPLVLMAVTQLLLRSCTPLCPPFSLPRDHAWARYRTLRRCCEACAVPPAALQLHGSSAGQLDPGLLLRVQVRVRARVQVQQQ